MPFFYLYSADLNFWSIITIQKSVNRIRININVKPIDPPLELDSKTSRGILLLYFILYQEIQFHFSIIYII